ncbi:MAG TPA: PH domain-containing protein [Edaphocola sp.]|nr:PH domain-containing protein [Edaphocola sp.]
MENKDKASLTEKLPYAIATKESELGVAIHFVHNLYVQVKLFFSFLVLTYLGLQRVLNPFYSIAVFLLFLLLYLLGSFIFAYYQYHKLLFKIDYEKLEFQLQKGVFHKTNITFQLDRIQQIHIKRNWLQRILGLSALEIDTAGSAHQEVKLRALKTQDAQNLMQTLMHLKSNSIVENHSIPLEEATIATKAKEQKWKVGMGNLLKLAISINPLKGLAIILIPLNFLFEYGSDKIFDLLEQSGYSTDNFRLLEVLAFVFALIIAGWVLNIFRITLKYFGFTFVKNEKELRLSHGLINQKMVSLRSSRIQLLTIQQNYLQRFWKITNIRISQFDQIEAIDTLIYFPALNNNQVSNVIEFINLDALKEPIFKLTPNKAFIRYHFFIRFILITMTMLAMLYFEVLSYWATITIGLLSIPIIIFWAKNLFKSYQLNCFEDTLMKHSGFWSKEKEYLNIHKIQKIAMKQYFWQKKNHYGKIIFYTAGGKLQFSFTDYDALMALQKRYLWLLEAQPQKWM